ncbi:F-box protein At1g67340-like [Rosa rugosa]|uniref:F-box protein At1g67340-like n=1 Tax=Rosa rugosa TaxID=74645 RepID=UPI002B40DDFB|nr:F-box protein At1g67340-like [Rosa rugosa]
MTNRKRLRTSRRTATAAAQSDFFDDLPDDLVVFILCKLSSSASSPSDLINVLITCKRLNRFGLHSLVLSKAGPGAFAIKAKSWSDSAHRFLKLCVSAGNIEACYTLGMIRFYCLQNRGSGASLMAKAAMRCHTRALYSLAVIQFNGSGGSKKEKDLRAGVSLCARAAGLGHIDALRELGHCLQDGYGVRQNVSEGRRLIVQANAQELATVITSATWRSHQYQHFYACLTGLVSCPLLSDFGCNVPGPEVHPANRFMKEWFGSGRWLEGVGLRMCSHVGCGRPETRPHEFRRCSVCGTVNYCSRGCQALDWKLRHKVQCKPIERWLGVDGGGGGDGVDEGGEGENVVVE